ncbi:LPP20 family lipoprotein [Nitrospira sp. Kam-Ns4a]
MDPGQTERSRSGWTGPLLAASLCLASLVSSGVPADGQAVALSDAVEPVGSGTINWSTGWVKATGLGAPPPNATPGQAKAMAERAAQAVALRNLLEVVKGVRVDSVSLVENFIVKSDVIRTQVSGFVRGAQVAKTDYQPDGAVEVTVKVPLYGVDSLITPFLDEKGIRPQEVGPNAPGEEGATGLVIDARGLGVKPACLPAILDPEGNIVYGPQHVDRGFAQKEGMAQYRTAPPEANLSSLFGDAVLVVRPVQGAPAPPREGRRPLKIKGSGQSGPLAANVMISSEDAKRIREDPRLAAALRKSRVVIVTDPLIGGIKGQVPDESLLAGLGRASSVTPGRVPGQTRTE